MIHNNLPNTLYYVTTIHKVPIILQKGLTPENTSPFVCFEDIDSAKSSIKNIPKSFIIEIESEQFMEEGGKFHKHNSNSWLTKDIISSKYLRFMPWYKLKPAYYKKRLLQKLKIEIGNRKNHFLYNQLGDLELVCNAYPIDDTLFFNKKTKKYYYIHLTDKNDEEIDDFPYIKVYNSFEERLENGLWVDQQDYYSID